MRISVSGRAKDVAAGENLIGAGETADASRDVHRSPFVAAPLPPGFRGMKANAHLWGEAMVSPMLAELPSDRTCTLDRLSSVRERHEEASPA